MTVRINTREIGGKAPVYFIADIASNHCGDLIKAKELIHACAESRVDAVKMQNFKAESIVSDYGFKNLGGLKTHQSTWKTSVFDSYKAASIPFEWTLELKALTEKLGMDYFTSPYSLEIVKLVEPHISAFKLGSGDITWIEEIELMASYNDRPLLIATGASSLEDVKRAVNSARKHSDNILVMQCNTNYTAKHGEPESVTRERFSNLNLKVLETYTKIWPDIPVGLSDHTHGSTSVLVATALYNCSAVEKHFTFDSSLEGQDHAFSMMPKEWLKMVEETAEIKEQLKKGLTIEKKLDLLSNYVFPNEYISLMQGTGIKEVEENEKNTIVVQRRAIRAARDLKAGDIIGRSDLEVLRPCPTEALPPYELPNVVNKKLNRDITRGDIVRLEDLTI